MRRGGWWGSVVSPVWPCCCWLCRGTRGGQAGAGVLAQPQGICRGSHGSGTGLSYLSSLLSLEFLREPVEAGKGLLPTEALLGVAWGRDSGDDTRDGAGRTGGRDRWQDLRHQHINCKHLEANRNLPGGGGGGGFARHGECPSARGRIRAPSHLYPPQTWVPWSEHPQRGSPKHPQAAWGCPLLTSLLMVSSAGRKRRRRPRWWRTSSRQSLSWQDEPHDRRRR